MISIGAFCSDTGIYTLPSEATKTNIYQCIDCKESVFLKQGEIKRHHFCHYSTSDCKSYLESDIHKNAKLRMKSLLEQKCEISFTRICSECLSCTEFCIETISDASNIIIEFPFKLNNQPRQADIAFLENDKPYCMIEICNTHATEEENRRPEPWYDIEAKEVLEKQSQDNKFEFTCKRKKNCIDCIEKNNKIWYDKLCRTEILKMNASDLEFYIRYHLGQREFTREYEYLETLNNYIERRFSHKKISFHENDEDNDNISKLFSERLTNKRIVIRSYKGSCSVMFTNKLDTKNYTFEEVNNNCYKDYSGTGYGTIMIITDILRTVNKYEPPVQRIVKNLDDNTDADTFRNIRYKTQYQNKVNVVNTSSEFDINNIKFVEKNHLFIITHPLSKKIIRYTNKSNKLQFNGKWIRNIYIKDIVKWYKSPIEVSNGFEHMWSLSL